MAAVPFSARRRPLGPRATRGVPVHAPLAGLSAYPELAGDPTGPGNFLGQTPLAARQICSAPQCVDQLRPSLEGRLLAASEWIRRRLRRDIGAWERLVDPNGLLNLLWSPLRSGSDPSLPYWLRPIMPFQATEAARCPKCGHQVFAAEEMLAAGAKWHKICFTCGKLTILLRILPTDGSVEVNDVKESEQRETLFGLCKKRLDSTNSTEHNGDLWCKICYSRKFGPKGGENFGNQESVANKPMDPYYGMNSKFINLLVLNRSPAAIPKSQ
ncbi:muscle LIM protein Mlp84B-like [Tropilaelaps mercedesae]|uniref:Muscle LIM protein Mlp84B-like n=1 Tax=Tropilaelaps mercedesae TaxID=418985 RepID=A0A1V9X7X7_9ACAR|nr:muscle LIM protein Mlp84B-like [Tropilaelaps mercedesae]